MVDALLGSVQKARHLIRGFAFDAHGQAKRAHFQVGNAAVQHLAKQVGRLGAGEGTTANFFDVICNAHAGIVQ